MSYPVSGVIQEIVARPTRIGDMYDVVVNGTKYGHGKYPPRGVKAGDFVSFEVDERQNGQYTNRDIKKGTLRPEGSDTPRPAAPDKVDQLKQAAPRYEGTPKREYVAFDERQQIISTNGAINTAIDFCKFAATNGAVPVSKSGKAADQLSLYRAWVMDEASRFYKVVTGRDLELPESAEAVLEGAVEKPKKAAVKAPPEAAAADEGYDEYPSE